MSNGLPVDAVALRDEVKSKYRSVAVDPHEPPPRQTVVAAMKKG